MPDEAEPASATGANPYDFDDFWTHRARRREPVVLPEPGAATELDRQVGVPRPDPTTFDLRNPPDPVPIDVLATKPWVESLVIAASVTTAIPLPELRELLTTYSWEKETAPDLLERLPGLRSAVLHGVSVAALRPLGDLRDLVALRIRDLDRIGELVGLERLRLEHEVFHHTTAELRPLERLRWVSLYGWGNVRALGNLTALERIELHGSSVTNFRGWSRLSRLRHVAIGESPRSLDGIEAFEHLEYLSFVADPELDLAPLRTMTGLRDVAIGADRPPPFGVISSLKRLRRFRFTGDVERNTRLGSIDFLAGLDELEEVELRCVNLADPSLDVLAALPRLRRVVLTGGPGPDVHELDRRRPDIRIEYHFSPEPEGRVHVGPVWYDPPVTPDGQWWILQDLHELLGTETNDDAERRLRRELKRRDGSLLDRLSFDTEAGGVGIYATEESDIRRMAELIGEIARERGTLR